MFAAEKKKSNLPQKNGLSLLCQPKFTVILNSLKCLLLYYYIIMYNTHIFIHMFIVCMSKQVDKQ